MSVSIRLWSCGPVLQTSLVALLDTIDDEEDDDEEEREENKFDFESFDEGDDE